MLREAISMRTSVGHARLYRGYILVLRHEYATIVLGC
jgi:hypothetical protein